MIIELIIGVLFNFANYIISLMPVISLPIDIVYAFGVLLPLWRAASFFVPFGVVLKCLAVGIMFYNIEFFISVLNWLIRKIPTIE